MAVEKSAYEKVAWLLDLGSYGRVLTEVRELEDRKNWTEAVVLDLLVFLKRSRQQLLDGDFDFLIGDIDEQLREHEKLGFDPVEEAEE